MEGREWGSQRELSVAAGFYNPLRRFVCRKFAGSTPKANPYGRVKAAALGRRARGAARSWSYGR